MGPADVRKLFMMSCVVVLALVAVLTLLNTMSSPSGYAWWKFTPTPKKTLQLPVSPTVSVGDAIVVGNKMCKDPDGSVTNIKKSILVATIAEIRDLKTNQQVMTLADTCDQKRTDIVYEAYCYRANNNLELKYKIEFCPKNTKCSKGKCV